MGDAYNGLSTLGYSQLVRIAPDGSQTVLLDEQRGQLTCSANGLSDHNGKLYLPVMGRMLEYDVAAGGSAKVILDNLPWGDHSLLRPPDLRPRRQGLRWHRHGYQLRHCRSLRCPAAAG